MNPKLLSMLRQLEAETATEIPAAFKATYRGTGNSTFTYVQIGSNSAMTAGGMTYYSGARSNAVCNFTGQKPVCYSEVQPLNGLLSLIIPANANRAIRALETIGTSFVQTTESSRGKCLAYTMSGEQVKYCINSQGLVSYISTPFGTFKLKSVTTNVAPSEVSVPA